jgi:nucleotidyltransferase/DNA polymerase involved in DNA repair
MHCIRVVAKGESSRFLRDLSIDWLRLGEFSTKRLRVLGIGTIGQFMRLPAQSLLEQFGPDAAAARRAIDDEEKDTVVPRSEPSFLERSVALDYPIVSIDSFFALAHALAASMVAHLRRHCLACQTVALYVELEDGQNVEASAQLKEPADSESDLLVALQKLVARMRSSADNEGDAGIVSVRIVLGRLTRLVLRQDGFFDGHRRRRAYLDRALDEIKERYGERVQSGITLPRTTTRTTNGHVAYPEG